ncbi:hypothetical protein GCM10023094_09370 [Rhodococcus olei]|uniref:Uncharacterized protein n=1 Tax=Rhodococcus olei TaxID=2161675 RepID=A0ABP8NXR4_9NOCA
MSEGYRSDWHRASVERAQAAAAAQHEVTAAKKAEADHVLKLDEDSVDAIRERWAAEEREAAERAEADERRRREREAAELEEEFARQAAVNAEARENYERSQEWIDPYHRATVERAQAAAELERQRQAERRALARGGFRELREMQGEGDFAA